MLIFDQISFYATSQPNRKAGRHTSLDLGEILNDLDKAQSKQTTTKTIAQYLFLSISQLTLERVIALVAHFQILH